MTGVKVLLCCKQTNSLEQIIINNVDSIVRRWYTRMRGNMGGDGGKVLELVKDLMPSQGPSREHLILQKVLGMRLRYN